MAKTLHIHSTDTRAKAPQCALLKHVPTNFKNLSSDYEQYLAGNCTRDDMLEKSLPLLRWVVARWLGKYSYLSDIEDDIASVGVVTILSALDSPVASLDFHDKLTSKLISATSDYVNSNRTATGTCRGQQLRMLRRKGTGIPESTSYETLANEPWENMTEGEAAVLELIDTLLSLCETPMDVAIVSYIQNHRTIEDIASEFNVTRSCVWRRRKRLYKKLMNEVQAND